MQKVVIIGRNSYLAAGLQSHLENCAVSWLEFNDWRDNISLLAEADWIINFAMSPACYQKDMPEDELLDIQIARCIKDFNAKYIFISSRKVYGQSSQCICHKETDPLLGQDWYARNKIKTEQRLKEILPGRLTILRISNSSGAKPSVILAFSIARSISFSASVRYTFSVKTFKIVFKSVFLYLLGRVILTTLFSKLILGPLIFL